MNSDRPRLPSMDEFSLPTALWDTVPPRNYDSRARLAAGNWVFGPLQSLHSRSKKRRESIIGSISPRLQKESLSGQIYLLEMFTHESKLPRKEPSKLRVSSGEKKLAVASQRDFSQMV